MVKSGQEWSGLIVTRDDTGALSAASVGPVGVLYVNGVVNGAGVTITGANPYKWTVTLPTLTAGDCLCMYVTATVDGVETASVVAEDVADTIRLSDGVAVTAVATDAITAAALKTDAADEIADHVWDEVLAGHLGVGSTGEALNSAGAAGDPWNTALPGAYTAGKAGYILGTYLPSVYTNAAALVARLGAFAGSGVNTVLGLLRALMRKDLSAPSDVGGTYDPATDSLEALRDGGTVSVVGGAVVGDTVTVYTYTRWNFQLTGLGSLASRTALYFTVKRDPRGEADSVSMLQVKETTGALYLNRAAAGSAAYATLVVDNETTGSVTVTVTATGVGTMGPERGLTWEVKEITADGPNVVASGLFHIDTAVARATT